MTSKRTTTGPKSVFRTATNPLGGLDSLFDAIDASLFGGRLYNQPSEAPCLTMDRMRRILKRIAYKPGWRFAVEPVPDDATAFYLDAHFPAKDKDTGRKTTFRGRWLLYFANYREEYQFVGTVFQVVLGCEQHEAAEMFLYDGDRLYDPHANAGKTKPKP